MSPRHVAIVRAARFVTKGQVLAAEDMEVATITDSPPAGAIADPGAALGKLALTDIRTDQPISAAMLQPLSGLDPSVHACYRAINIQTTDVIRTEERRVGKEWGSKCRSWWGPCN